MSELAAPVGDTNIALQINRLRKSYGDTEVLRGIDLSVRGGQVHALLGSNGAGKSTLLGCLSGANVPDEGTFTIGGKSYTEISPATALSAGVATIYQHFQLIAPLSVAENIFLGSELRTKSGQVDKTEQKRRAGEILALLGSDLSPTALVRDLSPGQMQLVEIARAIRHDPKVLILDEPTAALGDKEVGALISLVKRLASQGIAIIYVTHLLNEVFEVADVVTVLRDGQRLWTRHVSELTQADLVEGIAPQSSIGTVRTTTKPSSETEVIVGLENYRGSRTGPFNLQLRSGEIVGVFGLMGSGRTDLLESMAGVRRGESSFCVGEDKVGRGSIKQARRAGLAFIPSDRKAEALFTGMSALDNVLMPHLHQNIVRHPKKERSRFMDVANAMGVHPMVPQLSVDHFSGGNAQKLVIARWLLDDRIRLLLIDEPTQGVDIGARGDLYRLLQEYVAANSRSVMFATSDPEEALRLADRIVVLNRGRVVDIVTNATTETELLAMAHGSGDYGKGRL